MSNQRQPVFITRAQQLPRELRKAGDVALKAGWRIQKGPHLKWLAPDGVTMVVTPSSPGEGRAIANSTGQLRRAGLKI